ncbi:hypothetical protein [Streptomyces sp. MP131-18]|uniref:hypothetical protein n=1 Tax=Streptomyces sp. MP131-18 TaxID=1857892 RepID=UPI00097BB9AE|nr:hypothetical protein [Streptomyces sp. MP131-18]ONK15597.1 hypothetical protein STBA_64310 [Streptomyces sp. MP131-18]
MQLPAGHGTSDLPHTRAGARHWLITALALAAVTAAAALVQPSGATATQEGPSGGPDPARASYPVDCGPLGVVVADRVEVDLDADGRAETVAVVHCDAGSGTPPHGVYVLAHPTEEDGAPRVAETLVDPGERMTVDGLGIDGGTISARLLGYSAPEVPRCCPDMRRDVSWAWQDGRLELTVAPAPNSV